MNYREVISQATVDAMERDPKVVLLGQNVTTPHGVFGTTTEAYRRFPERCIEIPISETMITGACVGLALEGFKPILIHTRADFSLFSFEHLINTAAKIPFLRKKPLPFVMRCVVGRGWGQGPVHSQSFHHMLAQVPGLNVVVPARAVGYEGWLRTGLEGDEPTVIIEPRRLYDVSEAPGIRITSVYEPDIRFIAVGDASFAAGEASAMLREVGIKANCYEWEHISGTFPYWYGPDAPQLLIDMAPRRPEPGVLAPPFMPQGVSQAYEKAWYPTADDIVEAACEMLGVEPPERKERDAEAAAVSTAF